MTRGQAREMGRKLHYEGMSRTEIAKKLQEAGYVNRKGGGPLSESGVGQLLDLRRRKRRTESKPVKSERTPPPSKVGGKASSKLQLVRLLCTQTGMSAEDRIAAILLMTEG